MVWSGESETKFRVFKQALGKASVSLQEICWNEGLLLHKADTPRVAQGCFNDTVLAQLAVLPCNHSIASITSCPGMFSTSDLLEVGRWDEAHRVWQ